MPDAPHGERVTEPGPPPSHRRSRHRLRSVLVALALVVVGLVAYGVVWYEGQVHEGPAGSTVIVDVPEGTSMSAVTAALARRDVVGSGLAFRIYLALHGAPTVQVGRYQLRRHEDFGTVRQTLAGGPNVFAVTVLPGTTVSEVAHQIDTDVPRFSGPSFLAAVTGGDRRSPWQPPGLGQSRRARWARAPTSWCRGRAWPIFSGR